MTELFCEICNYKTKYRSNMHKHKNTIGHNQKLLDYKVEKGGDDNIKEENIKLKNDLKDCKKELRRIVKLCCDNNIDCDIKIKNNVKVNKNNRAKLIKNRITINAKAKKLYNLMKSEELSKKEYDDNKKIMNDYIAQIKAINLKLIVIEGERK